MAKIILIGGAPTVGKSTLAQGLAKHFDMPWISTDQIRGIMREASRREDNPNLFQPKGYENAEKFLENFSANEIAKLEIRQGEAVWSGIKKFIEADYTWKDGFIVEGVNLLPNLIARDLKNNSQIQAVFLTDQDPGRVRQVIFSRGLADQADTYSDAYKEKEVEWTLLYDTMIRQQAQEYGFPVIEITKEQSDLKLVIAALELSKN